MTLGDIKIKAKGLGIKVGSKKKSELIHSIQLTEGNFDCFGTAINFCDQGGCCFMKDCLGMSKVA
ncbi:MAG: SAP domain-containing protein [Proteobacteria bacterium]|nr:SAP domain-containing protein [Pseudomonadota bacterium]